MFTPAQLARVLFETLRLPRDAALVVAFSGGLDSHALLHAACALREGAAVRVRAVHVNHRLHPDADAWAAHCRAVCAALDVPLAVDEVAVARTGRAGPEANARAARYAALVRHVGAGEVLLTAHQRDDQAETLLLHLLRGGGLAGAAAMAPLTPFGRGRRARPLLQVGREALRAYARGAGFDWVEDPSNADLRFARNVLRRRVLPLLEERWPAAGARLARAAAHAREAQTLLDALADDDLAQCGRDGGVSVSALSRLAPARARNALRRWIRTGLGHAPQARHLEAIMRLLENAAPGAHAHVSWPGGGVRRYRDVLFLAEPAAAPAEALRVEWDVREALALPALGLRLHARPATGEGLALARLDARCVNVRVRRGGERCRLPGRAHRHALKKLLQSRGVPPWRRARLPLVYVDDELAAVADLWVCAPFAATAGERGVRIEIESLVPREL